jgi:hypothetical protein
VTVLTRQACIDQLPAGSDPLVIELHLAATAPDRHASRVAAVHAAITAAYPTATEEQRRAICAMEAGGIGGPGGTGSLRGFGEATRRMGWARVLGKGRHHATDGAAWDAAICVVAGIADRGDGGVDGSNPVTVAAAAAMISGTDLEWPLAHALRYAYADRDIPDSATAWATIARDVAARCEPDSRGGRLAARYSLPTLAQLYSVDAMIRGEILASMLGLDDERAIRAGDHGRAGVDIMVKGSWRAHIFDDIDCSYIHCCSGCDTVWSVWISTRSPGAADPMIRRGWAWREGSQTAELERVHAALNGAWGGAEAACTLIDMRARWDAEEQAAVRVADLGELDAALDGFERRAVDRAREEGVLP